MRTYLKQFTILMFGLAFSLLLLTPTSIKSNSTLDDDTPVNYSDTAVAYKAKCNICHKANAEKAFDIAKTDEQHIEVILTGKKMAKPPHMPGYHAKGMNSEQAKAFVSYMRQLRAAAPKTGQ